MINLREVKTFWAVEGRNFKGFQAARLIINALKISISFITIIPIKKYPDWNKDNLRFFCLMLPVTGMLIGVLWDLIILILGQTEGISNNLKGVIMTLLTLAITGGLHMDGLIDTFDAVFSHREIKRKLEILSDSHVGAFGVIFCSGDLILKSALFSEIMRMKGNIFLIPVLSRLGMGILLNNLKFAKNDGLAKLLGSSRNKNDNLIFLIIVIFLSYFELKILICWILILIYWWNFSVKKFGGITGDLLGAFVEVSEVLILLFEVIMCI